MARSVAEVFKEEASHVKVDAALVKSVSSYERSWVNGREENIQFFGGVLMGIPTVVFTPSDRHRWFDDVIGIDDLMLKKSLHALPTINPKFKVSSDEFNQSCIWLVHRFLTSSMSPKQKEEACIATLRVMHYRFITSLMHKYFKYPPNREIMEATYAALSGKFSLKQQGSWSKLIDARCKDIIDRSKKSHRVIYSYNNDKDIVDVINDIQGRIREVVKKMYRVFIDMHKSASKIQTRKDMFEHEGELHVRDLVRKSAAYTRYAHSTVPDEKTFIRDELVSVILDAVHTANDRALRLALSYMSTNYTKDRNVRPFIDETLLHLFDFLKDNRELENSGARYIIIVSKLKAIYMSSRSTDPSLMKMRDLSHNIAKKALKTSNESLLASVRNAMMLYVVLRTLTMEHYS